MTPTRRPHARTLTIDIGGTGIKVIRLDPRGRPLSERERELTPKPATPGAVLRVIRRMIDRQGPFERVSVGFPGVVEHGIVRTAPNLDDRAWRNVDLQAKIAGYTGKPTRVINDADLLGLGAIAGRGLEMVLTLGTGLGSALFIDGRLVPNLELGHHPFKRSKTYEAMISDKVLKAIGKKRWRKHVDAIVRQLDPIFNYEALHLGGGNARHLRAPLPPKVRVFDNVEGLSGGIRLWRDEDRR